MGARRYPLYLCDFRYRCGRTGKWRKARYPGEVDVIRKRYAEFDIVGAPMVIDAPAETTYFPCFFLNTL